MSDHGWLEISLEVDGEMAEAVAEVLRRFIPDGVAIETTAIDVDASEEGEPVGPLRIRGFIPVDAALEEKRQRIEEALWFLSRIRDLPEPEFRLIKETDWSEVWKQHYKPVEIGRRLYITPAWIEPQVPGRIAVKIDPGMAFGTGTHPTTRLCLALIDDSLFESKREISVLDVGCGSGILSIAALKLGAPSALAVDIDPLAVDASRQNAQLNGVAENLELGVGSVSEILAGHFSRTHADLVIANILAPVIIRLFEAGLGQLVSPGGQLILSGILLEQSASVLEAAAQQGFQLSTSLQETDWIALSLARSATPASS